MRFKSNSGMAYSKDLIDSERPYDVNNDTMPEK